MAQPGKTDSGLGPDEPPQSATSSHRTQHEARSGNDDDILDNINGRINRSVGGFYQKYFENEPWSHAAEQIAVAVKPRRFNALWDNFPNGPSQDAFLNWFRDLQTNCFQDLRQFQISIRQTPNTDQPDLYLGTSPATEDDITFSWSNVQVIGDFCHSISGDYRHGLLRLYRHAGEVFMSQPTRRFLHGFYISGFMVELWVFDRCRLYSCEPFSFRTEIERFITVMAGYAMMSDLQLGLNALVKEENGHQSLFVGIENNNAGQLYLDPKPIAYPKQMVGRGVTCYRAREPSSERWNFVVKFGWRSEEQSQEEKILRLVRVRKVWGVVTLLEQRELDSMAALHQGLQFGLPRRLSPTAIGREGGTKQDSSDPIQNVPADVSQVPSAYEDVGAGSVLNHNYETPVKVLTQSEKRKIESGESMVFSCVISYPYGRTLVEFKNMVEFLEALRDAIKAHRSLYQDGKILHQDISINNIIITEPKSCDEPKGILIDLDAALDLTLGDTRPGQTIGTKLFMAIGLLRGDAHTYRHDLESFLYILLFVAVGYETQGLPQTSRLRRWMVGDWDTLAQSKTIDMMREGFEKIISEFSPQFDGIKKLAEDLREILFPIRGGSLYTGTVRADKETNKLYDDMVSAFEAAITNHQYHETVKI
jgi:Fungal protein kinase